MAIMHQLCNTTRPIQKRKRVGRGPGSKLGRTCGRGEKGAGSRSGYKRRWGYEGGQMRLHMKLPKRGFNYGRFRKDYDVINLGMINEFFADGEEVTPETLYMKGLIPSKGWGVKILGEGVLEKKVSIFAHAFSQSALEALQKAEISYTKI